MALVFAAPQEAISFSFYQTATNDAVDSDRLGSSSLPLHSLLLGSRGPSSLGDSSTPEFGMTIKANHIISDTLVAI